MIRAATMSDADEIALLSGQLGYPATPAEIADRLRHLASAGDSAVFVMEDEGRLLGWIQVVGVHHLESAGKAEIAGLVVAEDSRGRGIGARLLDTAERWAGATGYGSVRVRCNVIREETHRFYKSNGYSETKRQAVFDKRLCDTPSAHGHGELGEHQKS
jgi:GNAT superfamily N-acetyltransferase